MAGSRPGAILRDNGPMDDPQLTEFEPAVVALARAWNRLDPDLLMPWLAENVRYDSAATDFSLQGRRSVLDHFRRKVARIEEAGEEARIRAQLGWVCRVGGRRRACVISSQGGADRSALFIPSLTSAGLIERIEICTSDPDPAAAEATEVFP